MVKKLVIVGLFILLVVAPVVAVHGQTDFSTYCTQKLQGNYSVQSGWDVCTIPVGKSSVLPLGDTFALMANQSITIEGTLTVNGTLNIEGGHLVISGTLNNFGAITNKTVPTAQGYGVKNYGTLNNNGALTIWVGSELWNYGVLNNYSLSLTVSGKLHNTATGIYSGSFTNQENAQLSLTDNGYFRATPGTTNTNYGEIKVGMNENSNAEFIIDPTLTNHGIIINKGSFTASHLINESTGQLFNDPWADWTCTGGSPYSTLINRGKFTNRWMTYIIDNGIFTNESSGTFDNYGHTILGNDKGTSIGYGKMYNHGTVINRGYIFLTGWSTNADVRLFNDNDAVIANFSGSVIELGNSSQMYNTGLIEHSGVIRPGSTGSGHLINYKWDNVNDPGIIEQYCGGSITVSYSGPPPVDLCCKPPAVTSHPASTVITYGQDATFSVAGTDYSSVQWQFSFDGEEWSNIDGFTNLSFTLSKPTVGMSTIKYRAVLTGECGDPAISNPAMLTVNKAATTTTVTCPASVAYNGAAQEPCTAVVTGPELNTMETVAYQNNINAGTATASANYPGGANWLDSSDTQTFTINKSTPVVDPWPTATAITYGQTLNASTLSGGSASVAGSFAFTNDTIIPDAGTYEASVTFTPEDGANHTTVSGSVDVTVNKQTPRIDTWPTPSAITYGQALSESVLSEGSGSVEGSFDFTDSTITPDAGTFSASVIFIPEDEGNYNSVYGSVDVTVNKAEAFIVVDGATVTYDGEEHGANGSATGVKGEALAGLDLGAKFTNVPGGTANWTFTDRTGNYNDASGSVQIKINKADAKIYVFGTTVTYTGNEVGASGYALGVNYETLAELSLGAKFTNVPGGTANWHFHDVTGNYNNASGSVKIVIEMADADCSITGYTDVYDGDPHGASGNCIGVKKETLTGLNLGSSFMNVPGGTAEWTFTDVTGNYNNDSGSVDIVITKAATTTTVTCPTASVTYNGAEQTPCTAAVTGPGGLDETLTVTYQDNINVGTATARASYAGGANWLSSSDQKTFTIDKANTTTTVTCPVSVTYDGAEQTPCTAGVTGPGGLDETLTVTYESNINAGTATANASYAGGANWLSSSDQKTFTIDKAATTTIVTCPTASVTYDGLEQTPCTAGVTGPGGLNETLTVSYQDNINAGTATARASYVESANYLSSSDSKTFTIGKAATTTTVTCPTASVTYSGSAQTPCTASVTGPGGLDQSLTVTYENNINAGTATASASYAESANYLSSSDSKTFTIGKAETTTTVTCPSSVTFDGVAQTPCTAGVTGPGGLDVSLTVTYQDNINAGTATANASYAGGANWLSSSDSKTFTIGKAETTTTVTCPTSVTFDGVAQTPCTARVTGPGGLNQTLTVTYHDNINAGTATASASYTGGANYLSSSDSKTFTIDKAETTTTLTCPADVIYNGLEQTPCTAGVTGPGGLNDLLTVTYQDNINAGTATANASYAEGANWLSSDDSKIFSIEKAATTTTVTCPVSVPFIGSAQEPCTAEVTGPGGLDQSLTVTYENNINPGTATASASYAGGTNWLPSSDSKTFTIIYLGESQLTTARTKCAVYAAGEAPSLPKLQYTLSIDRKTGVASIKSTTPSTFLYYVKAVLPDTASTLVITQENLVGFPAMGAAVTLYDENCAKLSPLAATVSIGDGNITIEFVPGLAERIVYAAVSYTARSLRGQVVESVYDEIDKVWKYPDIDYFFSAALDGKRFTTPELYLEWKVD